MAIYNVHAGHSLVCRGASGLLDEVNEDDIVVEIDPGIAFGTGSHETTRLCISLGITFAFTDIEMVFDEESHAVDWIFRYGNRELGKLEKFPLEKLINSSFGSIFPNMDSKWLRNYERSAIFGDIIETMDYSPEIDKNLNIYCYQPEPGYCACVLVPDEN